MTDSNASKNLSEIQAELLRRMQLPASETLASLAAYDGAGDEIATLQLVANIQSQQKSNLVPDVDGDWTGIKSLKDRSALARKYAQDETVPVSLREIFQAAASLEDALSEKYSDDYVVASPDTHHFAALFNRNSSEFEISTVTKLYAPAIVHFATLLMNPVTPDTPVGQELPLADGRMERVANYIADETGYPVQDVLLVGLSNVLNIAAWRYGKEPNASQLPMDYFLRVGRVANKVSGYGMDDSLFAQALSGTEPQ